MPDLNRHLAHPSILAARERLTRAYAAYDALPASAPCAAVEAAIYDIAAATRWVAAVVQAAKEGAS